MRRMPGLNDLRVFEAAARLQNFRQAAEALHLTHGAVSHRVRTLEDQLGVSLFDRQEAMRLTAAGRELYSATTRALNTLTDALDRIDQHYRDQPGVVRLSVLPTFASHFLVPRLPAFQQIHPNCHLRIEATTALAGFGEQGVDVSVRYGKGTWPNLHAEPLMHECYYPVASPSFLARFPERKIEDLCKMPLIGVEVAYDFGVSWSALFSAMRLSASPTLALTMFDDSALAVLAAEQGMGVALGRHSMVHASIRSGKLQRVFDVGMRGQFHHYLVRREMRPNNLSVQTLIDWLHAECEQFQCESQGDLDGIRWLD
ncbi:LysR family transcriptional regulator [Burkholderiaceae bacterium DAT-1]|nr:LysR family transcriptional regulator [Burkholderiaceae bacterium DAT-1]